jgi:ABC-2 type transport system permease protein
MVAKRELKTRMVTKANVISLVVMVVLIAVGAVVGNYFLNRDSETPVSRIAVAQETASLRPQLEAAAATGSIKLEFTTMTADDAKAVLDGTVELPEGKTLDASLDGEPAAPRMLVASEPDAALLGVVSRAVQEYVNAAQVSALGGDPETFAQASAKAVPQVEAVRKADGGQVDDAAFGVAVAMISVLFGALVGTGSMIAMGVVEEKTSRVVEILLATIRPSQLLAGKVLGIGLYGLFQMLVLGGSLAIAALSLGAASLEVDVGSALAWMLVWFVLGYSIFALLFGGFAALVSRQEDIGSVTTPLLFLLFIPFYTTMFLVPNDPSSTLVRVLSQIPIFAPFMMPVRDAFGALQPWEMPLAVTIAVLTIPGLVWLAARVYKRGVLHTGGRMKLSEALRAS